MTFRYHVGVLLLVVLLAPQRVDAQTFFTARLTVAQQPADVDSDATGTAALALTEEGLRFFVTVDGLTGPIANAHFHRAAAGESGGVVRGIIDDFDGNTASGIWTASDAEPLTDELVQDLLAGNLYLNIHTAANPGGEIRGQVYPTAGTGLSATLTAAQAGSGVISDAAGTASVLLTDAGALFFVTVEGLSGPLANAHFHKASVGESGGVVRGIADNFVGNTAFGLWTASDGQPLTDDLIADLLLGNLYLNIHTAANPGGEIRGQVLLTSGWGFSAGLDAAQQPGGVTSDGLGTASLTLTDAGLVYQVTLEGLSGPVANAHFHRAPAGANGGVVHGIFDRFIGNTASGVWRTSGDAPLTDELIQDLLAGNLYLNIHTAANPGGEVRGQVLMDREGTNLTARLTPAQQTADVDSDGSGTAVLVLTEQGLSFQVSVDGLTGSIANAHIHRAPTGESGGVVRGIAGDFVSNMQEVTLTPSKDNTLYEDATGGLSNGSGSRLFAGRTNQAQNSIRRALMAFDVAGALPPGAVVESVELTVTVSQAQAASQTVTLHRVEADWGEGASVADRGQGGGAPAAADDATWTNTFFNTATWTTPGGDFAAGATASVEIGAAGTYTVNTTPELVAAVQAWLDEPDANFGWLLQGNEAAGQTAKAFDSREGANPPELTITYSAPSTTASGLWTPSDTQPLTDELIQDLLAGNLYLNIHTAANPPGEIRGQIHVSEGTSLRASLTNEQQSAEVTSDGSGTAAFTLTDAGLVFDVTVDGLSGPIANAHFHRAATGNNGGVVRGIADDFDGNTASGLWTASDGQPLTDSLIQDLLTGNLYLNIHTAANPGGEIRGQVLLGGGIGAAVQLSPEQQTAEVMSDGAGTAALTLTEAGLAFDLTATSLTGPIANAHFHQAPLGQNGGVVRGLLDSFDGNTASGLWTASDAQPLTDERIQNFLAGDLYLNIHTVANPGGEIRGQVRGGGIVATAIETVSAEIPEGFTLEQNYPNPFNPSTVITFALDRDADAVLTVYNMLGQKVATLIDRRLSAGTFQVTFEAGGLPTGVYSYQLKAGGHTRNRTMILLR